MKKTASVNEFACNIRRTFSSCKPVTKAFKSKRDYNRRDKSWKKFED